MTSVKDLHNECVQQKTECFKAKAGKLPNNKSDNAAMQKKITHIQTQLHKNKTDAKDKLEKAKSGAKGKLEKVRSDAKDKMEKVKEKQAKAAVQKPEKKKPEKKKPEKKKPEKKKPESKPPSAKKSATKKSATKEDDIPSDVMAYMMHMVDLKKQGKIFVGANLSPVSPGPMTPSLIKPTKPLTGVRAQDLFTKGGSTKSKKTTSKISPVDSKLLSEARKLVKRVDQKKTKLPYHDESDTLYDDPPNSALLTLGDARAIANGKKAMWIVEPQSYDGVRLLTHEDFMFEVRDEDDDTRVGDFYTNDDSSKAVVGSGSGFDVWWKVNDKLVSFLARLEKRMDKILSDAK